MFLSRGIPPEQKAAIKRQLALCSEGPVLRLRLNRPCSGSSFAVFGDSDRRVAFCPLSDFLGDIDYRKDKGWLGSFYDKYSMPTDHPPRGVLQRLRSILSENEALDKAYKIVDGPTPFECPETGLWGVRMEIAARKKLSLSKLPADPNEAGLKLHESALESFFSPISRAGGFALSPSAVDRDIKDCDCLFSDSDARGGLESLFERKNLTRELGKSKEPSLDKSAPRL